VKDLLIKIDEKCNSFN